LVSQIIITRIYLTGSDWLTLYICTRPYRYLFFTIFYETNSS
jgi:hypothetical protein